MLGEKVACAAVSLQLYILSCRACIHIITVLPATLAAALRLRMDFVVSRRLLTANVLLWPQR